MADTLIWPSSLDPLLVLSITGDPSGQGSIRTFRNGGMAYPRATVDHRNRVISELETAWHGRDPISGAVAVAVVFHYRRPDSHYWPKNRTRTARTVLRDDAPTWPTTKNRADTDKAQRLIGDALEIARVIEHDALIVQWRAEKRYAPYGFTALVLTRPDEGNAL
jgi:Holliday junction resolvase RusA-like endonuclease